MQDVSHMKSSDDAWGNFTSFREAVRSTIRDARCAGYVGPIMHGACGLTCILCMTLEVLRDNLSCTVQRRVFIVHN